MPESELARWAERYSYPGDAEVEAVGAASRKRGYLGRDEFLALCRWKTPRSQPRCATNDAGYIRDVTRVALATANERLKIGVLMLLEGVAWPTASVILHFCDEAPYPILDVRALWSAGYRGGSPYTFSLWWEYTRLTRAISRRTGLSMRTIDRGLWQYAKARQP